jgi:hypothetical protein
MLKNSLRHSLMKDAGDIVEPLAADILVVMGFDFTRASLRISALRLR